MTSKTLMLSASILAISLTSSVAAGAPALDGETDVYGAHVFVRALGGSDNDRIFSATVTSDGGVAATGYTYTYGAGDRDVLIVKFDPCGRPAWVRTLGDDDVEEGRSIIETHDGGLVVAGYTDSFPYSQRNLLLMKFTAEGDHLWTRVLARPYVPPGGVLEFRSYAVIEDSDHRLLITGDMLRANPTRYSLFLAMFGPGGDYIRIRVAFNAASASRSHYGYGLAEMCGNEGYLVAGRAHGPSIGEDILLAKFARDGYLDWGWWIAQDGNGNPERALGLIRTDDCGFALTGRTDEDLFVLRRDSDGDPVWSRKLVGDPCIGYSILEASDHGLVVTGEYGESPEDALLAKWSETGTSQWVRAFGAPFSLDIGHAVVEHIQGPLFNPNLWVLGRTRSWGAGMDDALVARCDSEGLTCVQSPVDLTSVNWAPPGIEVHDWLFPEIHDPDPDLETVCDSCPWDINCDDIVNVEDLLFLLEHWGHGEPCPADVNGDGIVDVLDLLELLAHWGPCP